MKKLTVFFLFLVCFIAFAEEREPWTFSHLRPPREERHGLLINEYPEFRELLEQIHDLINEREYDAVSRILKNEISAYNINTRHIYEFEKIFALIFIDAALDYLLLDNKQQGVNKQYMAFYLWGRMYNRQQDADYFLRQSGYTLRDHPYLDYRAFSSLYMPISIFSLINLKDFILPDSLTLFIRVAEAMPNFDIMRRSYYYDLTDFDEFRDFLSSFYTYSSVYDFDFEGYYYSFTIDNFIENFDILDFFAKITFFEGEIEVAIAQYWYEDDETRWFYSTEWDINEAFNMLSEDLLCMRDFSEDIRIFGNPIMLEGARRAADTVDACIPVIEMPIQSLDKRSGPAHEMLVFATFRQARAEAFFNQYYGSR